MRMLVLAGVAAIAAGVEAAHPGAWQGLFEQLYPKDPERRQALDLCFRTDHRFNRLDAAEREGCYRRMLKPVMPPSPAVASANFVDLWRAAGRGRTPTHDIRFEQQNEQYLRAVSAPTMSSGDNPRTPVGTKYRLISRAAARELPARRPEPAKP